MPSNYFEGRFFEFADKFVGNGGLRISEVERKDAIKIEIFSKDQVAVMHLTAEQWIEIRYGPNIYLSAEPPNEKLSIKSSCADSDDVPL